nr:hypothetical protein [Moraxella sp. CTOTU48268]
MNNFTNALRKSLDTENWYAVLFISLTLPDICGKIDEPSLGSKARTINWYNKYLKPTYTSAVGAERQEHVFLTGSDFYALRCAYLHEGSDDITTQRAREILEKFKFVQPTTSGIFIHRNTKHTTLQLQVSEFGAEVLNAVETWLSDISDDTEKMNKTENFLKIQMLDPSKGFSI